MKYRNTLITNLKKPLFVTSQETWVFNKSEGGTISSKHIERTLLESYLSLTR